MKTKPTQYAVRTLNSAGIQPDIIIARSEHPIDEPRKKKLSTFCNIGPEDIISAPDIKTSIYEIPSLFEKEGIIKRILNKFNVQDREFSLLKWDNLVKDIKKDKPGVTIGIVGKYFSSGDFVLSDSYLSVIEAVKHSAWANNRNPKIEWLDAEHYENNSKNLEELDELDGIIVPGGFGSRGTEGKICVVQYCREKNIPFLGLCYGMQLATVEYARNVCGLVGANTTEVDKENAHPVIDVMHEQKINLEKKDYGATMRLGGYECYLRPGTLAERAYSASEFPKNSTNDMLSIVERHRHRYELNNKYREQLQEKGLVFSGINTERDLVEIIELPEHKFFIGTQFHPEFTSRPLRPHPLFSAFIKAAIS